MGGGDSEGDEGEREMEDLECLRACLHTLGRYTSAGGSSGGTMSIAGGPWIAFACSCGSQVELGDFAIKFEEEAEEGPARCEREWGGVGRR